MDFGSITIRGMHMENRKEKTTRRWEKRKGTKKKPTENKTVKDETIRG